MKPSLIQSHSRTQSLAHTRVRQALGTRMIQSRSMSWNRACAVRASVDKKLENEMMSYFD